MKITIYTASTWEQTEPFDDQPVGFIQLLQRPLELGGLGVNSSRGGTVASSRQQLSGASKLVIFGLEFDGSQPDLLRVWISLKS
jgi:hypothetical protein